MGSREVKLCCTPLFALMVAALTNLLYNVPLLVISALHNLFKILYIQIFIGFIFCKYFISLIDDIFINPEKVIFTEPIEHADPARLIRADIISEPA